MNSFVYREHSMDNISVKIKPLEDATISDCYLFKEGSPHKFKLF